MVQIGPLKYTKKDEGTIVASTLIGLLIGLPSGTLLDYLIGFLTNPNLAVDDSIGWSLFLLRAGSIVVFTCWTIAILICVMLSRRGAEPKPSREIGRIALGTFFLPLVAAFGLLFYCFVTIPLDAFLHQHGIKYTYTIGILILTPFVFLVLAIIAPDTKLGKVLRRFLRTSNRHKKLAKRAG
jgi:hypothetical protein